MMGCLVPWLCAGRPNITCCKCIESSILEDEKKKYQGAPLKVIRCQECFVPCCLKVGFAALYLKIMGDMNQKVDKIIGENKDVNKSMIEKMIHEKE